jgi:ABC-type bacteriocin/lantibiotic exporter with double-glycine peptidase domain
LKEEVLDVDYDKNYFSRYTELFSIQKNMSILIVEVLECFLVIGTGMLIVALYHPAFLIFDVLLILSIYLVIKLVGKDGLKTKLEESDSKYDVISWIMSLSRPVHSLRGFSGIQLIQNRTEKLSQEFIQNRKKHFSVLMSQYAGFLMIGVFASSILLGVGGFLVFKNQLSLGQLVAAEIILAGVLASISKLDKIIENYYSIIASISKIEGLFSIPSEDSYLGKYVHHQVAGAFQFQSLNYQYGTRQPLWSGITLKIPQGSRVAVVGASGSGKSTFLEIVYGLRQPSSGVIKVDGFDYKDIDVKDFRDKIGFAGKFEGLPESLLDNITLRREVDFKKIVDLSKSMFMEEVIQNLPEGYQTQLDGTVLPFSDGQLARLSLLRALVSNPEILLIDEIFDEMDLKRRKQVLEQVFKLMNNKTVFITTHDSDVIKSCDFLLELPAGTLSRGVQ